MSNTKHLADLLKVCSILPALAIMPAMGDEITERQYIVSGTATYTDFTAKNLSSNTPGAAVYASGADTNVIFNGISSFENNTAETKPEQQATGPRAGGAIALSNGANATFNGDVTFSGNTAFTDGAALDVSDGSVVNFNGDALFTENKTLSGQNSGSVVRNHGTLKFNDGVSFVDNSSNKSALYNTGVVEFNDDLTFRNDSFLNRVGGTISLRGDGDVKFVGGGISNEQNTNPNVPGAVVDFDTTGNISMTKSVDVAGSGSVISNDRYGTLTLSAERLEISKNSASIYGGAVLNAADMYLLGKENVFANNKQTGTHSNSNDTKYFKLGGGALYNRGNIGTADLIIGREDGSSVNKFTVNSSAQNGGAIEARTDDGADNDTVVNIRGTTLFSENTAGVHGGAIMNWTDGGGAADIIITGKVDFENNKAGQNGGAIYNTGTVDLTGAISKFEKNIAGIDGGAIFNAGDMTISGATFAENKALWEGGAIDSGTVDSNITISKSRFERNKVEGEADPNYQLGGAMKISGKATLDYVDFISNSSAGHAGAIYAGTKSDVTISNSYFEGNKATSIGALWLFRGGKLTNVNFYKNYATDATGDGAGALFLGSVANVSVNGYVNDSWFTANESASRGGAISTRTFLYGDNHDAVLDIVNTKFNSNKAATNGGAFDNFFYHSATNADAVYVKGSSFVNNSAANGGAIYNHGSSSLQHTSASVPAQAAAIEINNAQFIGNIATTAGGAIYNEAGATVILSGDNIFSGNVAKGMSNDIRNMGTLNITSGKTTLDGGVDGTAGTFTLATGAELDIATAAIKQGNINLDGTVYASLLNDSVRGGSYGRFIGEVEVGDNAKFNLNVGATGTYNIWDGKIVKAEQVSVGDIYEIASIDTNGVKIVTKSVADIADTVGITTQAAGAVAGLANASSGKAHQISLALQDALNAEDIATVERETKKLNPTDKPVVQAAAASVQNQVLSLTSGRMAGGVSVGRAGGDEQTQENGFWIQGLFNKSKFGGEFHGYTRGIALGADTLIDKKWTIGGGLAFNNSDVHADSAHTDIDSKTLFLYGQYKPNNWFVNGTLTYNMSEYTDDKTVAGVGVSATYDVDSYGAQVMTGYDFAPGITTEAGLRYLHIAQDGYTDDLNLTTVRAMDTDFLSGVAGLKYAFAIENDWAIQLRPELRAAMTYDFISDDTAATVVMPGVASYKVDGERLSRMGGEFGIGLTALYKGLEVSLMYDLDLHQDYTSQTGMIKFRGKF